MNQDVAIIAKNGREEIRVSLTEYHSKQYADVRIFWRKSEDEAIPTKKGITIGADKISELISALTDLEYQCSNSALESSRD